MNKKTILVSTSLAVVGTAILGYALYPKDGDIGNRHQLEMPVTGKPEANTTLENWVNCTYEYDASKNASESCNEITPPVELSDQTGNTIKVTVEPKESKKGDEPEMEALPPVTQLTRELELDYVWEDPPAEGEKPFLKSLSRESILKMLQDKDVKIRLAYLKSFAESKGIDYYNLAAKYAIESQLGTIAHKASSAGATGHWQFLPASAARVGLKDTKNFAESTKAMWKLHRLHLRDLSRKYPNCISKEKAKSNAAYMYMLHNGGGLGLATALRCAPMNSVIYRNMKYNAPKTKTQLSMEQMREHYVSAWLSETERIVNILKECEEQTAHAKW